VRFQGVDVAIEGAAAFTGTTLEFGPASRGVVGPAVRVTGPGEPFRAVSSARLLACPAEPARCAEICAADEPPRWCASPPPEAR